ncbi:hypothetical protein AA0616_2204 [Komagataeibacter nataicola NRIC 0616]|nr:hypothetical protein AA0616_2204 [Komagataeibacter nataicola NRIC 0616]
MQRKARHHQIETVRRKGQPFTIHRDGWPAIKGGHAWREIGGNGMDAACAQEWSHHTAATNIERRGEWARDIIKPVEQAGGGFLHNGAHRRHLTCGAVTVQPDGMTVEYLRHIRAHAPWCELMPAPCQAHDRVSP